MKDIEKTSDVVMIVHTACHTVLSKASPLFAKHDSDAMPGTVSSNEVRIDIRYALIENECMDEGSSANVTIYVVINPVASASRHTT